ncbi:hypothetical protein [Actinoplanes sp. NPDC051494]|uniref:hypothetical protein n=1 Tax=Actinoplanes sp. NPDC051494 TaxID=3363907 RepID=UPI003793C496
MKRRTLIVLAGWLGAAVLAVVVGITAISVLRAGLTSSADRPLTAAEVDRLLRDLPSEPAPSPSAPSPSASQGVGTSPPPEVTSRTLATAGGTVVARCPAGRPEIVSAAPRPGFALHEQHGAEGEFRGTSDNHNRVKFTITCAGTTPTLTLRTSGGGDDD